MTFTPLTCQQNVSTSTYEALQSSAAIIAFAQSCTVLRFFTRSVLFIDSLKKAFDQPIA